MKPWTTEEVVQTTQDAIQFQTTGKCIKYLYLKLGSACGGGTIFPKTSGWGLFLLLLMGVQKNNRFPQGPKSQNVCLFVQF